MVSTTRRLYSCWKMLLLLTPAWHSSPCTRMLLISQPQGMLTLHGMAWHGMAWHGMARQGKARQGKARQGKASKGKARQGKARQQRFSTVGLNKLCECGSLFHVV